MTDSDRLNDRLNRVAGRRTASPAPLAVDAAKIIDWARANVSDPTNFRPATDDEMAAKEAEIRRETQQRKAEIMLGSLPARYRTASYSDLPGPAGLKAAQWTAGYREGRRSGLVILGTVGTGKTWLAAAIARDLLLGERPVPVDFITVADMLSCLRTGRPGLDVDMVRFMSAPVLVLDDLGQENQTDWTREQLYRLAHSRYHEGRPTIVTSNLPGSEIKATYESRTVERLFGGAQLIELAGESRRQLPF